MLTFDFHAHVMILSILIEFLILDLVNYARLSLNHQQISFFNVTFVLANIYLFHSIRLLILIVIFWTRWVVGETTWFIRVIVVLFFLLLVLHILNLLLVLTFLIYLDVSSSFDCMSKTFWSLTKFLELMILACNNWVLIQVSIISHSFRYFKFLHIVDFSAR